MFGPAGLYMGITAFIFVGAAFRRFDEPTGFALSVLLIGLVLALGPNSPVGAIGYHIPGLNAFRGPWKHLFEVHLGLSMLSAIGVHQFLRGGAYVRYAAIAVGVIVAGVSGYSLGHLLPSPGSLLGQPRLAIVSALLVALLALPRLNRTAVGVALVALVLSLTQHRAEVLRPYRESRIPSPSASPLLSQLDDDPTSRVVFLWRLFDPRHALSNDLPTAFRIPAVQGGGPFLWKPLATLLEMTDHGILRGSSIFDPNDHRLDLLSVRYIVSQRYEGKIYGEGLLRRQPGARLEEDAYYVRVTRSSAFPFVYLASSVVCGDKPEEMIRKNAFDLRHTAVVACSDERMPSRLAAAPGEAELIRFAPGQVELRVAVEGPGRGFLIVSQPDYPGWLAEIDGQRTPIHRVDALVQGMWVPPGEHRIRLVYWPRSFSSGVALSACAGILFALMAGRECRGSHATARGA